MNRKLICPTCGNKYGKGIKGVSLYSGRGECIECHRGNPRLGMLPCEHLIRLERVLNLKDEGIPPRQKNFWSTPEQQTKTHVQQPVPPRQENSWPPPEPTVGMHAQRPISSRQENYWPPPEPTARTHTQHQLAHSPYRAPFTTPTCPQPSTTASSATSAGSLQDLNLRRANFSTARARPESAGQGADAQRPRLRRRTPWNYDTVSAQQYEMEVNMRTYYHRLETHRA